MKTTPLVRQITLMFLFALSAILAVIYWSVVDSRTKLERLAIETHVRIGHDLEKELDKGDFEKLFHEASEAGLEVLCLESVCSVPSDYELVKKESKEDGQIEIYKSPLSHLAMKISYSDKQLFLQKDMSTQTPFEKYGLFALLGVIGTLLFFIWASVLRFVLPLEKNIKELLSQKERMLAVMSHEIKTPLAKAKLALEFIEDGKHKNTIKNALSDIDALSAMMLVNAEISDKSGQVDLVLATDILNCAVSMLSVDDVISINVGEDFSVKTDRNEFALALKNLLENGLKHSQNGAVSVLIDGDKIVVSNETNDFGQELGRLTEPFYKSQDSSGHGLGLYIVQKIAQKWGFELRLEHTDGKFVATLAKNQ